MIMPSTTYTLASLVAALSVMTPPIPTILAPPTVEDTDENLRQVYITVDNAALGDRGVGVDGLVVELLTPKLQEAGFELVDNPEDAIALHIRFVSLRPDKFDFGIYFDFVDGEHVEPATQWVACLVCVDANLRPAIDGHVPVLIEALEKRAASSTSAATDGNPEGNPPENGHQDPPVEPPPKPIGPVGISGVVVLAAGIGLSIGGGVVLANPKQLTVRDDAQFGVERDRTSLGVGLLVPGAALVVGGAIMLAVDVSKRAKQRKRAESITVIPTLSPTSAGLGIIGRF